MRFSGKVGYGEAVETVPGVTTDVITEYLYRGDIVRNTLRFQNGESVNNDLSVSNSISIVADAFAREHIADVRYVEWAGTRWAVESVEVQHPRLLLRLGSVYNGPTP
jgi:methyl coenzyme M reductase subunit C-like uncharacterized protein (methanogenesis marker protein 7)